MLSPELMQFLKDLSKNNNREWFHANKKRYEREAKKPFAALLQSITESLNDHGHEIEIAPKDMVFRINRDIRFSKDKSPYKTHLSAIISKRGRKNKDYPGYYLHIDKGSVMMGGGAYFLEKAPLYQVRQAIAQGLSDFEQIITNKNFIAHYGTIQGDANKRLPKEFVEVAKVQPLIANKQFYFMSEHDPTIALKEDFVATITRHFLAGKPVNDWLRTAIGVE
ncbi:MAG: DUF2461 domain-containing protein [Bacteroidota bacterium]